MSESFPKTEAIDLGLSPKKATFETFEDAQSVDMTESGAPVVDRRRVTPESVEEEYQKSVEALRAPLQPEERDAVLEELRGDMLALSREENLSDSKRRDIRDLLAAATLLKRLEGGDLHVDQEKGESVDDFLERALAETKANASVAGFDEKTNRTIYDNYNDPTIRQYEGAKDLRESLNNRPDEFRVGYLGHKKLGLSYMNKDPRVLTGKSLY